MDRLLPFCRRARHQDRAAVPQIAGRRSGSGADQEPDRPLLRDVRRGGLRHRVDSGRIFHLVARAAQSALPAVLHLQRAVCGLCAAGVVAAFQPGAGLRGHRLRVFQLRVRVCRADALHHAAGRPGQAPDGPLRLRYGAGQPGRDAAGDDQRCDQRCRGLPGFLRSCLYGHPVCGYSPTGSKDTAQPPAGSISIRRESAAESLRSSIRQAVRSGESGSSA